MWMIGIVVLLAWAIGQVAAPQAGWWIHIPLLLAAIALGYAALRPRRRRESEP